MKNHDNWDEENISKIEQYKTKLNEKEIKKYRVDILKRIVVRVDEYSNTCEECMILKEKVQKLIDQLNNIASETKEVKNRYFKDISRIVEHLRNVHKLVESGYYTGVWISLGMIFGMMLGAAFISKSASYMSLGMLMGICIGISVGASKDAKAKEEGKII